MSERIRAHGKQLLIDGEHLADCRDPEAAAVIEIMLNHARLQPRHIPAKWIRRVESFFA